MMADIQGEEHLFMLCERPNRAAFTPVPDGYHVRACRPDELAVWMDMPFDNKDDADMYRGFMQSYFDRVYASRADLFFARCTFVCDHDDNPVATAFIWPISAGISTFHWLKVVREHEGRGLGRAIVSHIMQATAESDYPMLLHTHPASQRALKLYSDFGFALLSDPVIGSRTNDLERCLPFLRRTMPAAAFDALVTRRAPEGIVTMLQGEGEAEF